VDQQLVIWGKFLFNGLRQPLPGKPSATQQDEVKHDQRNPGVSLYHKQKPDSVFLNAPAAMGLASLDKYGLATASPARAT